MKHAKMAAFFLSVVILLGLWVAPSVLAVEQPRYGGTLRVALAADPPSLDMHQESTFAVAPTTIPRSSAIWPNRGRPRTITSPLPSRCTRG